MIYNEIDCIKSEILEIMKMADGKTQVSIEEWRTYHKMMTSYLVNLGIDNLRTIITIMYIGRDSSLENENGSYDFYEIKIKMDKQWHDVKLTANQIAQKTPLKRYLEQGLEKINYQY